MSINEVENKIKIILKKSNKKYKYNNSIMLKDFLNIIQKHYPTINEDFKRIKIETGKKLNFEKFLLSIYKNLQSPKEYLI